MRNFLLLFAALSGTVVALPAAADSDEGSCRTPSTVISGPIDLEAIPMKDVTDPKVIKGVGDDDECGDAGPSGKVVSSGISGQAEDAGLGDDDDD